MTREDAISDAVHYARHRNSDSLIESCINDIFNDHEAQLKAKDEELISTLDALNNEKQQKYLYQGRSERIAIQLKVRDEEIERLKKAIDTSIEEIEYAIKKPQYAEVYLGNAIRVLKNNA